MKDVEIWADIEGYEGLYQVSNNGNVRSLKFGKVKVLRPSKDKDGYLLVVLHKNGKSKSYRIHRLVAQAFLENPNNLPEINHKDENKENNCVDNLEYCDRRYNVNYSLSRKVSQYNLNGELVKRWNSTIEASIELDFDQSSISAAARNKYNGNSNFYKGYYWSY